MKKITRSIVLAVGMMMLAMSYSARSARAPCPIVLEKGRAWLATGVVTRIDGPVFNMLGKDNMLYAIDATNSLALSKDFTGAYNAPRVGDTVRVYGAVASGCRIRAARIRLIKREGGRYGAGPSTKTPEKEIKIIIEKRPAPGVGEPTAEGQAQLPTANWEARGLIMDIDYAGPRLTVRTSNGLYTINIRNALLERGGARVGLGSVNPGDAVRVVGNLVGLNEVSALRVHITRTRDQAYNALPELPASVVGTIRQVDYPSMTFTMLTERSLITVLADADTVLQIEKKRMAFMELRPGMRIKMSGYGNPANGYVAHHIQIISLSP